MPMTADELLDHVRDHRGTTADGRDRDRGGRPHGRVVRVPTCVTSSGPAASARRKPARDFLPPASSRNCSLLIDRLTEPGAVVYDPFCGQGDDAPRGRPRGPGAVRCDINPLSRMCWSPGCRRQSSTSPRASDRDRPRHSVRTPHDLEVFFHADTLVEIAALRHYLHDRERAARWTASIAGSGW